ncbi:hypothetical protein PFISCL1PPCAC_4456, partial [Pristionchus fissidentatus]
QDYISGQPDEILLLIFSFIPGGKWSNEEVSALNALSLTCRRFYDFLTKEKNLRRLCHFRADLDRISIFQNATGMGIVLSGEALPCRVSVIHNYQTHVTKRSYRKMEWKLLSGGSKAPCELGIPSNLSNELRKILMRFNPRCFAIGGASFISKQATADLASCLSEFPKIRRLDLCSNLKADRNTELTPSDLARIVCNFERLFMIETRFLVNELIQSWISDEQYDNYCFKPARYSMDIVQCSAISMHNFECVSLFDHDLSMVTLSDLPDAVERRPLSKGIRWKLSLSCDEQEIDNVIQNKALKLGYTVYEVFNGKDLDKPLSTVRISWNDRLTRYSTYTFRPPLMDFYSL